MMKTQPRNFSDQAVCLGRDLAAREMVMATAESCTGGLIAHLLTNVPGSSRWFTGGVVAYSNQVKVRVLHVPEPLISKHGAVSGEVALAMAAGAKRLLEVPAALAVSGIAGPDGGTLEKPVGTVWMAWVVGELLVSEHFLFSGSRLEIKQQSADAAVLGMLRLLRRHPV
jgi:nicotinamide-nucleotide amidase